MSETPSAKPRLTPREREILLRLLTEGKEVPPELGEKIHVREQTVRNMIQSILGGADEPTRTSENDASRWQPPPPPRRASPRLVDGPQVTQIRWSSRVAAYIPYPRVVEAPAEAVSTSACGYF